MVTCVNLTFTQGNPLKEYNMAWDTQWSPSFVNMFKATGTQFSATIFAFDEVERKPNFVA